MPRDLSLKMYPLTETRWLGKKHRNKAYFCKCVFPPSTGSSVEEEVMSFQRCVRHTCMTQRRPAAGKLTCLRCAKAFLPEESPAEHASPLASEWAGCTFQCPKTLCSQSDTIGHEHRPHSRNELTISFDRKLRVRTLPRTFRHSSAFFSYLRRLMGVSLR